MSNPDPVVALVAERFALEAACEAKIRGRGPDETHAIVEKTAGQIGHLDDRIAGIVATSAAGVIGQLRVLREICEGVYADDDVHHSRDCADRLMASIAAGVDQLGARE